MTTLLKQSQSDLNKLDNHLSELKAGNQADLLKLQDLEQQYEQAVNTFDSKVIDKLHADVVATKSNMDNRSKQIAILSNPNNPIRLKAKAAHQEGLEKERQDIKDQADVLHGELMKARASYVELALQVSEVNLAFKAADRAAKRANGISAYGENYLNTYQYQVEIGDITPQGGN